MSRSLRVLGRGLRLSYDHLGMVLVGSALYFVVGLVPAAITLTAALRFPSVLTVIPFVGVVVLLVVPGFTALLAVARSLARGEEVPALRGFWQAFRAHFGASAGLGAAGLLVLAVLVADLVFFLQAKAAVLRLLAGVWAWLLLYAAGVLTLAPAVRVWVGRGVLVTLKQAALIVLDNVVVTATVMASLLVLAAVSTVLGAPLLLLFGGTGAFVLTAAMEAILERYRLMQDASGKAGGES